MTREKFMCQCFICGGDFQCGPHIYRGRRIARYDIDVCDGCYNSNWDGWNQRAEKKLIAHLEEKGIPIPKRNAQGWLPRE